MANPRFSDLGFSGTTTGIGVGSGPGGGSSMYGSHSPFGTVPGPIAVPPNTFSQVSGAIPNFASLTKGTSDVIGSELSGQVSDATMKALENAAATYGVASGMPGSGLQKNSLFANIAGFSEAQQRKGLEDYLGTTSALSRTMTDPGLAADIASRNANLAAAPDPDLAHQQEVADWLAKFKLAQQYSGPGGGTGAFRGGRPPDASTVHLPSTYGRTDALGMPLTDPTWTEPAQTPIYGALGPFSDYQPNLNWQGSSGDTVGGGASPIYGPANPNQFSQDQILQSIIYGDQAGGE